MKIKEIPFESVLPGNRALIYPITSSTINRDEFFKKLDKESFSEVRNERKEIYQPPYRLRFQQHM